MGTDLFQCPNHLFAAAGEAGIGGRVNAGVRIDNGQDAKLRTQGELVMHIRRESSPLDCFLARLIPWSRYRWGQLPPDGHHAASDRVLLDGDHLPLPAQQDMPAPIAIAHTNRRRARTDGAATAHLSQISLIRRATAAWSVRREVEGNVEVSNCRAPQAPRIDPPQSMHIPRTISRFRPGVKAFGG